MGQHLIIGRMGCEDRDSFLDDPNVQTTNFNLVLKDNVLAYGLREALLGLKRLDLYPSEIGLDLLILAAHVYLADTRISRNQESQDSWTRELQLLVPVSNTDLWNSAKPLIKELLDFLTGDLWTINFRARPKRFSFIIEKPEIRLDDTPITFDSLSLFSGGLDSLIGAVDLLERDYNTVFISHATDSDSSNAQYLLYEKLRGYYTKANFSWLRLGKMGFSKGIVKNVRSESSTRSRSFLFFALGVFVGTALKNDFVLRVPENGFIALNVPLNILRLGANSTRTTHPFYINNWNKLLESLEIHGIIENPYWDKTKGEMIKECANLEFIKELIPISMSCSSPSKSRWLKRKHEHCGYCVPCLIRRAAIVATLGPEYDSTLDYTVLDLTDLSNRKKPGEQVRSFMFAIERLRKNPAIAPILIHKSGSLASEYSRLNQLTDVYRRGLEEVANLIH